jgi:type VI secretion system lysozyme-like protein
MEVRTPLFDRLVDRAPKLRHEPRPARTLDRRGLRESGGRGGGGVGKNPCPFPAHRLADRPRSVIDYGLPELSGFSANRVEDRERLAELIRRAVEAFEPRLAEVRVRLEPAQGNVFSLTGHIEAVFLGDSVPEPVVFHTAVETRSGKVEIDAGS